MAFPARRPSKLSPSWASGTGNSPYSDAALDPRTSSTQSLSPPEEELREGRRKLLLIYIHGFKGTETSFQSFPAHVHNLVRITLADSHIVHTKIYPRYKSKNSMTMVAEDFSAWLTPHEDSETDVVLLGHSMGGLLAAEIVFLPPRQPQQRAFRHRILGTINFDVPFLGLHPGIISSGLASLFKPAASPAPSPSLTPESSNSLYTLDSRDSFGSSKTSSTASQPPRHDTLFTTPMNDPTFNPSFGNDVILPPFREGWRSTAHFFNKHSNNIRDAVKQSVKMQAEFGRPLLDYRGLNERYAKLRALEIDDHAHRQRALQRPAERVSRRRFVNYYTACSGRLKPEKKPKAKPESLTGESQLSLDSLSMVSSPATPRRSPEQSAAASQVSLQPPSPPSGHPVGTAPTIVTPVELEGSAPEPSRTPTPQNPVPAPAPVELPADSIAPNNSESSPEESGYFAKNKQSTGVIVPGEAGPSESQSIPRTEHRASFASSRPASIISSHSDKTKAEGLDQTKKPKKDKTFCVVPKKDQHGQRDPAWVRVYIDGVDEVGAHCGLFVMNETYERLVGDVGGRVEDWVREAASVRLIEQG